MYLANNVLAKRFYGGLGFTKGTASNGALDRIHVNTGHHVIQNVLFLGPRWHNSSECHERSHAAQLDRPPNPYAQHRAVRKTGAWKLIGQPVVCVDQTAEQESSSHKYLTI